jgi:hypothetical protein
MFGECSSELIAVYSIIVTNVAFFICNFMFYIVIT